MITLLIILLIIFCVALGLFVLVQNPKGGGLATGGSGSNMFGVQRTGDVLEKGTWVLLTLIVITSLAITTVGKSTGGSAGESKMQEQINNSTIPSPVGNGSGSKSATPAPAKTGDTTKK